MIILVACTYDSIQFPAAVLAKLKLPEYQSCTRYLIKRRCIEIGTRSSKFQFNCEYSLKTISEFRMFTRSERLR